MSVEAGDEVVLANPSEVIEVPKGKLITIVEICRGIARKHGLRLAASLQQASS